MAHNDLPKTFSSFEAGECWLLHQGGFRRAGEVGLGAKHGHLYKSLYDHADVFFTRVAAGIFEATEIPNTEAPLAAPKAGMKISNPRVRLDNDYTANFCASFEMDGQRFHVWVNRKTREVSGPLYKNAPLGIKRGEPGSYDTRQLDPEAKCNAVLIKELFANIDFDQAEKEMAERVREQEEANAAATRRFQIEERVKKEAVELFDETGLSPRDALVDVPAGLVVDFITNSKAHPLVMNRNGWAARVSRGNNHAQAEGEPTGSRALRVAIKALERREASLADIAKRKAENR